MCGKDMKTINYDGIPIEEGTSSVFKEDEDYIAAYESTPIFGQYISSRYEASFDKARLISAEKMHEEARKLLGIEDYNE
jgi:hypothetical protein